MLRLLELAQRISNKEVEKYILGYSRSSVGFLQQVTGSQTERYYSKRG